VKKNTVTHPGIVKSIENSRVEIAIMSVAGCASCQLKGACSVSDVEEKQVWVSMADTSAYKLGQQVTIEMRQSLGTWAVLLGYVFPFFVLLGGLLVFIGMDFDQGLAGLLALAMLLPYYTVLYLIRGWLGNRFQYTLYPAK
jgi:sigma-E factor negative regulatory protein RseC